MAAAAMVFAGCSDSEYDLEKIVPGEYHKIMFVKDAGKHNKSVLDIEGDDVQKFYVYKSGSDPSLTASVTVTTLTDEELKSEYSDPEAVNYKALSADCYTIETPTLDFTSEDRYKEASVALHPQKVKAEIATDNEATWVLPLKVTSENDSVNANANQYFVVIDGVVVPEIGINTTAPDLKTFAAGGATDFSQTITVGINTDNLWDIEVNTGVDAEYVETYNADHNTAYSLMPEGSYEIPATVQLAKGSNEVELTVNVKASQLAAGDYMLPVAVTGVSQFVPSATKAVMPILVRVQGNELDRSGWTAEASSEEKDGEGAGNGVAGCMLDGNEGTFWHSQWQNGNGQLPYTLIVDMKAQHEVAQISLRNRNGYTDTGSGKFYVSDDKENWIQVGAFNMEKNGEYQMFGVKPTKARYFKIFIETSNRSPYCSISEAKFYGD